MLFILVQSSYLKNIIWGYSYKRQVSNLELVNYQCCEFAQEKSYKKCNFKEM